MSKKFLGENSKETFKSLREKYIRERDKNHKEEGWELVPELRFLDPHALQRRQSNSSEPEHSNNNINSSVFHWTKKVQTTQSDIDKCLVNIVRENSAIWDRTCNDYTNKQTKMEVWHNIAKFMNMDVNFCVTRWKTLREKYVRQKMKFLQSGEKWDLLDDMIFLDKVIRNPRKPSRLKLLPAEMETDKICQMIKACSPCNNRNKSCTDLMSELEVQTSMADSFSDSQEFSNKDSDESGKGEFYKCGQGNQKVSIAFVEGEEQKNAMTMTDLTKNAASGKEPEELFGQLVTSLLKRKPDPQKDNFMLQIMRILTKPYCCPL